MTLQQMNYCLTVADCGSMNKAARKLYIVQPTLTRAIQELEDEVGYQVFVRTARGIGLTPEGEQLLSGMRQVYGQYESFCSRYIDRAGMKQRFGVSTQHYSFAVEAFVEMAGHIDVNEFDLAIRETRTRQVIRDVAEQRSEIGILYRSRLNQKVIAKYLREHSLTFTPLIVCKAFVYLAKDHPLAGMESIGLEDLTAYPCLSFEQGEEEDLYFAEEILCEYPFPRRIKATDRATMLNLMVGLKGYTLCSGIISEGLNGDGYVVVPFREDEDNQNDEMEIGYVRKKDSIPSILAEEYIRELKKALERAGQPGKGEPAEEKSR